MQKTYWETVAEKRFGYYLSQIEKEYILMGSKLAGKPDTAIEVGCDGGRWSKMLRDKDWKIICTDINEESLKICKSNIPDAELIKVNPSDTILPINSSSAKLLLCIEVSQLINEDWFIDEVHRVLKKGAIMVLTVLNRLSIRSMLVNVKKKVLYRNEPYEYTYKRNYSEMRKKLTNKDFEIINEVGCCWIPFSRSSNSVLIPFFAYVEKISGLRKLITLSPMIILIAKKVDKNNL